MNTEFSGMHMDENTGIDVAQPWFKSRFLYLIVAILFLILMAPFLQDYIRLRILLDFLFSIIFITAMFAVSRKKHHFALAIVLVLPMILSLWASYFVVNDTVFIVGRIFGILFFAFAIVQIAQFIFRAQNVTKNVLFAAIVVYLLIALMWSFIYGLLEVLQPDSFNVPDGHIQKSARIFLYYSFVTITTLGYGDITPLTDKAKSFAILEAFVGQIYLVVVVAWLVGMFVSQKSK